MVRREEPVCRICQAAVATEVDHIVPLRAGGPRLDRGNLQALCHQCHTWKTKG
ncbi:MAG: HNH endonuclease, partial [Phycisphaerae bacterium]